MADFLAPEPALQTARAAIQLDLRRHRLGGSTTNPQTAEDWPRFFQDILSM